MRLTPERPQLVSCQERNFLLTLDYLKEIKVSPVASRGVRPIRPAEPRPLASGTASDPPPQAYGVWHRRSECVTGRGRPS